MATGEPSRLDDSETVKHEYATEDCFVARRLATWAVLEGANAEDVAATAIADASPSRVLDAGCGPGDFAERLQRELRADVVGLDLSPRMVELARGRGLIARVGDLQQLPFNDAAFDCVVANRVLYHLPDLDRGLREIGRVLSRRGRLIAVAYGDAHLRELWSLLGREPHRASGFTRESGALPLRRHFASVERRDISGRAIFPDRAAVLEYLAGYERLAETDLTARVPDFPTPFVAHYEHVVFVAAKPLAALS